MSDGLRIDKWLWYARFFKSRSLASTFVTTGRLRLNGTSIAKAHQSIRPGDVLTFPLGPYIRVIKVEKLGTRRGPAPEARTLYDDLDPPQPKGREDRPDSPAPIGKREPGSGRPTKTERRATDKLRGRNE